VARRRKNFASVGSAPPTTSAANVYKSCSDSSDADDAADNPYGGDRKKREKTGSNTNSTSSEVQCLKAEIDGLKQSVKLLSDQLSFVLSFLGVSGENSTATTEVNRDRDESSALFNFPPLVLNQATAPGTPASPTAASLAPVGSNYRDAARLMVCNLLKFLKRKIWVWLSPEI